MLIKYDEESREEYGWGVNVNGMIITKGRKKIKMRTIGRRLSFTRYLYMLRIFW